jgi:F-box and WD-40 domain protein CDC4
MPEKIEVEQPDGSVVNEIWSKEPLIVSGSRDGTLRVWALPSVGGEEYIGREDGSEDPEEVGGRLNLYFVADRFTESLL